MQHLCGCGSEPFQFLLVFMVLQRHGGKEFFLPGNCVTISSNWSEVDLVLSLQGASLCHRAEWDEKNPATVSFWVQLQIKETAMLHLVHVQSGINHPSAHPHVVLSIFQTLPPSQCTGLALPAVSLDMTLAMTWPWLQHGTSLVLVFYICHYCQD